jgi:signal peptidase I
MEEIEGPAGAENARPTAVHMSSEPGEGKHGPSPGIGRFLLRALWNVASTVLPAVFIALFVNVFVAQAWVVEGPSMQPNLHYDQRVMVEKVTYRFVHGPRRGDIVIIDVPGEEEPLIKRVVALPGETVQVHGGQVSVDGEPLVEPWVTRRGGLDYPSTLVPPLHVFVLGDNRGSSRDSRSFGPVSIDQLVGRALFVYWPPDQIKLVNQ